MIHVIDHLVLPVTTLALARSRLTSLGFTVAPDARHPFGTGNCCVFFANRTYLEPVTIVDRTVADEAAANGVFFVRRIKRFTERQGEGFAMLALNSNDAEADRAFFEQAGIIAGPTFRFSRMAALPDGGEREIGVVLAYAEHPGASDATLFTCQHLAAEVLFQAPYLAHPNGAVGVGSVIAVAENPGDYRALISAVTGVADLIETPSGLEAALGGQTLCILTPDAYRERFGLTPPDAKRGMLLAACDMLVADLDRAIGYAGPTAMRQAGRIVVPPGPGLGMALAFRVADDH
jgi:hypothetical protein